MEERDALKRQIELLQNLINNHKSVHGNAPSARADQWQSARTVSARGRGQSTSFIRPHGSRGRPYNPQPPGHWWKTHSLGNKISQSSIEHPSAATSSSVTSSNTRQAAGTSHSTSLPSQSTINPARREIDGTKTATVSSAGKAELGSANTGIRLASTDGRSTDTLTQRGSGHGARIRSSGSTATREPETAQLRQIGDVEQRPAGGTVVQPRGKDTASGEDPSSTKTNTSARVQSSTQLQIKPRLPAKTSTVTKQTATMAAPSNVTTINSTQPLLTSLSAQPSESQQSLLSSRSKPTPAQIASSRSKFTWVKSHDNEAAVGPRQAKSVPQSSGKLASSTPTPVSNAVGVNVAPSAPTISKRTPSKRVPRRHSPITGTPKTSKYTWVSSSALGQARLSRKPLSPRVLGFAQRTLEKGESMKKLKPAPAQSAKQRKGTGASSTSSAGSSRYCWKAGGQSVSGTGVGGATGARRGSAFHWRSDKSSKEVPGGQHASVQPSSSPGGFKLRSRMKIIRRPASSGMERRTSPPAVIANSRYSLLRRTHTLTRSPMGMKRTPCRELVSFGRHKLRRLSPTSSRAGPTSPSHRSPTSQRVFRTRYKMVTRTGASAATFHYSSAVSWRAKRIQSARTLLQSRLRSPQDRHPPSQPWRGRRDMRWIGGSLYRVSANKLSRTMATSTSINRTGRWYSPHQMSPATSPLGRPSNTRHVASRAVQRSLAIIRHAHQKKHQRQYCMYYNRFGKCNRGNSCPYIHDPDKVAVCTRFLRGTCKQTDGTCPFSHKVAKEKMPVCSYFLKGICNNVSCPYSHVYVSRKAAVCQDFIKGYCPQGEKCKKKHTLVCPDFSRTGSCPKGSQCKLQHHQRAKRNAPSPSAAPAKRGRTKDLTKRPRLSVIMPPEQAHDSKADPGSPTSGPLKLPSFISLSSSPEEAEVPDTPPAQTSQVTERKMQIKPRL